MRILIEAGANLEREGTSGRPIKILIFGFGFGFGFGHQDRFMEEMLLLISASGSFKARPRSPQSERPGRLLPALGSGASSLSNNASTAEPSAPRASGSE